MKDTLISTNKILKENGFISIDITKNKVGHYEIPTTIEGKIFKMIIDTGASNTVVDLKASEKAGFKMDKMDSRSCIGGLKSDLYKLGNKSLQLDTFNVERFNLMAMDFSHINKAMKTKNGSQIDGVIGVDFLTKYSALIDYGSSKLYLRN